MNMVQDKSESDPIIDCKASQKSQLLPKLARNNLLLTGSHRQETDQTAFKKGNRRVLGRIEHNRK